jgi:hypothetical protein
MQLDRRERRASTGAHRGWLGDDGGDAWDGETSRGGSAGSSSTPGRLSGRPRVAGEHGAGTEMHERARRRRPSGELHRERTGA